MTALRGYRPPAGAATTSTAPTPTAPPSIRAWDMDDMMPSALFVGASGTGKTTAIGRLCAAGFNVAVVVAEKKMAVLKPYRPLLIDLDESVVKGDRPTPVRRYDAWMRALDHLARGGYREHDGRVVDIFAVDGATEISGIIEARHRALLTDAKYTLPMWGDIAEKIITSMREARDAAGAAAAKLGIPPIAVVMTCLEKPEMIEQGVGDNKRKVWTGKQVPILAGQKALETLMAQFEVAWRFSAGTDPDGEHRYRIHTVTTDEWTAKSPAGVFDKVVTGRGAHIAPDYAPDAGRMFKELMTNPLSPYASRGGTGA